MQEKKEPCLTQFVLINMAIYARSQSSTKKMTNYTGHAHKHWDALVSFTDCGGERDDYPQQCPMTRTMP